jgi:hypothetical protein
MCRAVLAFLLAGFVGLAAFGASPPAVKGPTRDHWRYTHFNGDWWYWLPQNRWVYWRNGQWNDFPLPAADAIPGAAAIRQADPTGTQTEVGPFYGHAESLIDYGPSRAEEIGPFYGHALPGEVFGSRGPRSRTGPYYGHADSPPQ